MPCLCSSPNRTTSSASSHDFTSTIDQHCETHPRKPLFFTNRSIRAHCDKSPSRRKPGDPEQTRPRMLSPLTTVERAFPGCSLITQMYDEELRV